MSDAVITFAVDESLKNDFAAAAEAQGRAGAEVLRELMRDFTRRQRAAEYDAWFRREVEKGMAEARAGDMIPHEEVEAESAAWWAEIERQIAERGHVYNPDFDLDPQWYKDHNLNTGPYRGRGSK